MNVDDIDEVVASDNFERLHLWLFGQLTVDECRVAAAASVYDSPFDLSHCSRIIDGPIEDADLKTIVVKLKNRFVLTPYDTIRESKRYVMHPCLKLFLSNSTGHRDHVKSAMSNFVRETLKELIDLTKRSWRKDGLKDATLDFKRDYALYEKLLQYFGHISTVDAIQVISILKEELKGQEWVLVKMFFFLGGKSQRRAVSLLRRTNELVGTICRYAYLRRGYDL